MSFGNSGGRENQAEHSESPRTEINRNAWRYNISEVDVVNTRGHSSSASNIQWKAQEVRRITTLRISELEYAK